MASSPSAWACSPSSERRSSTPSWSTPTASSDRRTCVSPLVVALGFAIDLIPTHAVGVAVQPAADADGLHGAGAHPLDSRPDDPGGQRDPVLLRHLRQLPEPEVPAPFIEVVDHKFDRELFSLDKAVFLGHEPAIVLHDLLGDGISAEFLSSVYLWSCRWCPGAGGLAGVVAQPRLRLLVRDVGALSPGPSARSPTTPCRRSVPASSTPGSTRRSTTNAGRLMNSLAKSRVWAVQTSSPSSIDSTNLLSGVAGFASLHVAMTCWSR